MKISLINILIVLINLLNAKTYAQSTNIDSLLYIVDCKELQLPLLKKKYGRPIMTYEITYTDGHYGYGEQGKPKKIKRKKYTFNNSFSVLVMSKKDAGKGYKGPMKTLEIQVVSEQNPFASRIFRYTMDDIVLLLNKNKIDFEQTVDYIKIKTYNIVLSFKDEKVSSVKKCCFYCSY